MSITRVLGLEGEITTSGRAPGAALNSFNILSLGGIVVYLRQDLTLIIDYMIRNVIYFKNDVSKFNFSCSTNIKI